ncbi:LOW QUALITY PROTEIN: reverse transcriptase [Phytophthora megakarya]|uniref:Reverse transcriptase n=1 Tax=Phytophthora megakarya TaxID=4795 RepID=A0A225UZ43_9STRA|nr:LOW QUALITY PROTEIN: reverse transcriptase [Phytophthora megakarya]
MSATFGLLALSHTSTWHPRQMLRGGPVPRGKSLMPKLFEACYAANQKGWKILDCNQGAIISLRSQFRKLASRHAMDFEYYSRTATSEVDLLFYSQCPTEEKPSANDVVLLEEFVAGFDMDSVNIRRHDHNSVCTHLHQLHGFERWPDHQRLPVNLFIQSSEPFKQAELLVALKNRKCKESLCAVVSQGMGLDPATYREAMTRPDAARWREATDAEIASLLKNKTQASSSCKWVFKRKFNSDGTLERYKARLVVIGCQQIKFIDFDDVFAPVVCLESLRVLLAIVCIEDLECEQIDIEIAFLNSVLEEEVYMQLPQWLKVPDQEGLVCRLQKSLYGLKQAP